MKRKITKSILIAFVACISISVATIHNDAALAKNESKNINEDITTAQLEKLRLEISELKNKSGNKAIAEAQLKKINLEISELKNKDRWENIPPSQYIQLFTTFIAVCGFIFTIFQFFQGQKKDRTVKEEEKRLRDESQIRNDIEQLLSLDSEKEKAVGEVFFLLKDLNTLADRNPAERQKITTALIEFIQNDCNFDNLRHIRIDIAVLKNWSDYQEYLSQNASYHDFVMYKYFQAFRHMHDEDKIYFESIKYKNKDKKDDGFDVSRYTEEDRFLKFTSLISGYEIHLKILKGNQKAIQEETERFSEALNNTTLTYQLFN
jgi:hypothetical protein